MIKILVLDDDQSNAEVIQLALEAKSFVVESICHSDKLKNTITKFKPDLLVMDILLDKGDGQELCNFLKKNPGTSHLPVLLITAMLEAQAMKVPNLADDIIFKPFDFENLHQKVSFLIR